MNPTLLTFAAILVFTGGLVVGYVTGWGDGAARGFSVGWTAAHTEVRRVIARLRP